MKRFATIWFPYLKTDWFSIRQPDLRDDAFVLVTPDHGRMLITAANEKAIEQSIYAGMVAADAKAIRPSLTVIDDPPGLAQRLLKRIAGWCIRFSPCVTVDGDEGLILDATGCTHLWGGDADYANDITARFRKYGYTVRVAIADTIGAAWALSRYGKDECIIEPGQQSAALLCLPGAALRLDNDTVERLNKLGLRQVKDFIGIPKSALRRRFGRSEVRSRKSDFRPQTSDLRLQTSHVGIITRINQALGLEEEFIQPVHPPAPYQERLPCLEPIVTATGIEIALQRLLDALSKRLKQEGKGIRKAVLKCYRVDGKIEAIEIGTIRASHHAEHLFRLFELKISSVEPGLGIELFILEATKVEDHLSSQETIWKSSGGLQDERISELLDRLSTRIGVDSIRRYLPAEHYWPERSVKAALSLDEEATTTWKVERPRPLQLLSRPEPIEVMAPVPDYPPMNFRYKGKLHTIIKADGPERIEQEWWMEQGQHRDYYYAEDEEGCRYWLFRLGHYADASYKWFVHGYFI
ncbi:MAG TPA: DNA polymerase Y family protein [Chitinophagaceae bacterium]|nr:DNA polymerase Y family protein [Chitinophagaceae bacterium]